ncbi:MAG TPA: methyltransferase domain-containing protein [Solirubrobacteraceae bacterium]|jgi:SAM-dependent methyltransferase|nr:methyltransferase domain-containing protein [Solirubrobacteraceae bacterium]
MSRARRGSRIATERSAERLRAHWEIERELADRLRRADRNQRAELYGVVYDELFRRVPDHPQNLWRQDEASRRASAARQAHRLEGFLPAAGTFLEVGAGDCAMSFAMAARAGKVYAIEVSEEIASLGSAPENFELVITDGRSVPVPPGSVDLVYSNQLMEHLHPDDAAEQLEQIFRALRPGGRYICLTPNRLLGPSDISMYFSSDEARGFHLREYDNRELRRLMSQAGFASVGAIAKLRGHLTVVPLAPFTAAEAVFEALPAPTRRRLKGRKLVMKLLSPGGGVIATKP